MGTPGETFFSKKESLPRPPFKENQLREVHFRFYYGQIRSDGEAEGTPGETFFSEKESLPRTPFKENQLFSFLLWTNPVGRRPDLLLEL